MEERHHRKEQIAKERERYERETREWMRLMNQWKDQSTAVIGDRVWKEKSDNLTKDNDVEV